MFHFFASSDRSPCSSFWLICALLCLPLTAAHAQSRAAAVIVETVDKAEVIEELPLTGSVVSSRQARLSAEISGLVETISVEIGDEVSQGDTILKLKSDLEALSLQASQAEVEQARRELADAKRRLADAERLGQSNTVSANTINSLKAEVSIDSAEVTRLMAEEQRQLLRLQQHDLTAPFDGVISAQHVERGEWVNPGQAVLELVSLQSPLVEFRIPQWVYPRLAQVSSIELTFAALPGETFTAQISRVVPVTERASRTFLLRARLVNDDRRLIPGISASAVMKMRKQESGVVVSRNALIRYPDGRVSVWVIDEQNGETRVAERLVETGLGFAGQVNIVTGLQPGERVVVNGNESLRPGQTVLIKPAMSAE